jgi:hypothetical protein
MSTFVQVQVIYNYKHFGTGGTGTTSKDVVHTVPSKYELWFKRLKEK